MSSRLPQQIPSYKEDGGALNGDSSHHNKIHIYRIWDSTKLMSDTGANFVSD